MSEKVITRFAPSPTGFMHVGGVRTALYAWLWARKNNGQFILRIEDTDKEREVAGSIEHIKKSLKWLGLNWDEGPDVGGPHAPYIQSERLETYKKYADILIKKGLAYADPYTEEELETFRKQSEVEKKPFLYREHRPENPPVWDGTKPLRFKVSELKRTVWNDIVWGELSAGPEALDDFILIKSDGYPTYNFAHVVDDIEMGVTHVVRGQEFISSTPKFLSLYEAFGVTPPLFVTTPPIMAADGKKKLGKRDGAKDILDYEKEGYLPEAMINYLAFLGFNPGGEKEIYKREELLAVFDLTKIQRSGAQWSDDKLNWMNKEYMSKLTNEEYYKRGESYVSKEIKVILTKKEIKKLILQSRGRIKKFGELDNFIMGEITQSSGKKIIRNGDSEKEIPNSIHYTETTGVDPLKVVSGTSAGVIQKAVKVTGGSDYLIPRKDPIIDDVDLLIPEEITTEVNRYLILHKEFVEIKNLLSGLLRDDWKNINQKDDNNNVLWIYATKRGRNRVLSPLRIALSGKKRSEDVFEIMKKIGKQATLRRIKKVLKILVTTNQKNPRKKDTEVSSYLQS